jgi:Spy/CpxP family protein refolding chaperone
MTDVERQILAFVAQRESMFAMHPTRAEIRDHVEGGDIDHAINALWEARHIQTCPLRRAHAPRRFQITQSGKGILENRAVSA